LFLFGLAIFVLISTYSTVVGIQQKIHDLPITDLGTAVSIIIDYPDSPFPVDHYFESIFTFQVKSFGEGVEEIFIQSFNVRLSVNFRDYNDFTGPFKIISPDESKQKIIGFYLYADEAGIFPGQSVGARLEYQMKWSEHLEAGSDSEYDIDWRLVDYISVQDSLLPSGVTGPTVIPVRPIFGFKILPAIAALFMLIWIQKKRKNAQLGEKQL